MSDPATIALLEKIDRQVEEQGSKIDDIQNRMADGRVRFEQHDARIRGLESSLEPTVERAVTKALARERATSAIERKQERAQDVAEARNVESERISIGGVVKLLGALGAFASILLGAYAAGGGFAKPKDDIQTHQAPK